MAYHLFDFEQACDQICSSSSVPAAVLVETSPDGLLRSRPVNEQLVESYIEKDFKVDQERNFLRSILTCKQEEPTGPSILQVKSSGSTIKLL
jgi:hypothetical protein